MSKQINVSTLQTNFTAGELSTFIDARVDYPPIFSGARKAENVIILPEGGAFRRKGTRFIAPAYSNTKKSRMLPFQFSTAQAYALELADFKLRFFVNKSRLVETTKNITAITKANPGVVTSVAHGYSNSQVIDIGNVVGMTQVNGKEFTVSGVTPNTYELSGVNTAGYSTYVSGGTSQRVYEITTPYGEADLFNVKKAQKNDIVYTVDGAHPPQKLIRVGNLQWTIEEVAFQKGPFDDQNIVTTDLLKFTAASWTVGSAVTLTASGGHTPFLPGHVGSLWQLYSDKAGTAKGWIKITGYTSSTVLTGVVAFEAVPAALQGSTTSYWNEGEFSTVRGFPKGIALHEQRMALCGTSRKPNTIWLSVTNGDYENFKTDPTDVSAAFNITAGSGNQDVLEWLVSDEVLFAGSANTIFRIKASANGSALSNTDADIKAQSRFGTSPIQPVFVGESPFYVERGLTKMRSLDFNVAKDKYTASNSTIRSRGITGSGLTQLEYLQNPVSLMLAHRIDGQIAQLTFEAEQEVFAWARSITEGIFESSAVLPTPDSVDTIYFSVTRTIGGQTKRYIESLDLSFSNTDLNAFYVDAGLTYDGTKYTGLTLSAVSGNSVTATAGAATFSSADVGKYIVEVGDLRGRGRITGFTSSTVVTIKVLEDFSATSVSLATWGVAVDTVTGLEHLEGKTVDVFADGATLPEVVVSNGSITFAEGTLPGVIIHVGLNYESTISPMAIDLGFSAPSGINSIQPRIKKLGIAYGKFEETRGVTYVVDGRERDVLFRSELNAMGKAVPLFTGFKELNLSSNNTRDPVVEIVQREPQPMHLKSIFTGAEINAG